MKRLVAFCIAILSTFFQFMAELLWLIHSLVIWQRPAEEKPAPFLGVDGLDPWERWAREEESGEGEI